MSNEPAASGQFDFQVVKLFARRYLETYYEGVNEDEPPIAKFIAEHGRKLPHGLSAIEIGCGPTVHHALALAPYVGSLDMSDYLSDNIEEIRLWKENDPKAFPWHHYTEMILQEEGTPVTPEAIEARENLLREKMGKLLFCDVMKHLPVENASPYQVVLTCYCAEEVGTTPESWQDVMGNISRLVAPGGSLFLSALRGTNKYMLGDPAGKHEWLPCAEVTEESLKACLLALGYEKDSIHILSVDTLQIEPFGIPGILVAVAKKP